MNRVLLILSLFCLQLTAIEVLTEAKVGYFLPTDSRFRTELGEDSIVGELEASINAGYHLYPWTSIGMYDNTAHAHGRRTHAYFIPVGAGLKYLYPFKYFSIYAGAGALPTYYHVSNGSTQSKWGCGGIGKIGFISNRLWNFFLDLFGEYSYIKIDMRHHVPDNLSNFTIGGGVGYAFGPTKCFDDEED